jgi:hypothetical protein
MANRIRDRRTPVGSRQIIGRYGRRIAAIAICCGLPLSSGFAADWQLGASLTEEFVYDDNIRLETGSPDAVWGLSTKPQVSIEGRSPRFDLGFSGGLDYSFFEGQDDLDSFDQNAGVNATLRQQRGVLGFNGTFQRATTRTTEVDDTGSALSDAVRLSFSAGPSWSYRVTPSDQVGLRAGFSYVTFDTSSLNDYNNYSAGPFWSHQLTQKDAIKLSATYSRFERRSGLDLKSDTASGSAELSHRFTPRLDGFVNAGGNYVRTMEDVFNGVTIVSRTDESAGVSAGAGLTLKSDRASVTAAYSRGVTPSGSGRLQQRDSVNLSGQYKVSPMITANLATSFILQDAVDDGVDTKREFISASPGITWNIHRDWDLRMSYRFRTQTLGDGGERVYSNAGLASVTWRLPTLPRGGPQ